MVSIINSGNDYRTRNAEYYATLKTNVSGNKKEAAEVSLENFSTSLGNQRRMEAAGEQYNDTVDQLASQLESRTTLNLNTALGAAQTLGAIQADSGAAGVGGSSIELLSHTTELQRNITQQETTNTTQQAAKSGQMGAVENLARGLGSNDLTEAIGNFNYTNPIKPMKMQNKWLKVIGVAIATFFGGPQGGQAAADFAGGQYQYENQNPQQAYNDWDHAASEAGSAIKGYQERGGSWFSSIFGSPGASKDNSVNFDFAAHSNAPSYASSGDDPFLTGGSDSSDDGSNGSTFGGSTTWSSFWGW